MVRSTEAAEVGGFLGTNVRVSSFGTSVDFLSILELLLLPWTKTSGRADWEPGVALTWVVRLAVALPLAVGLAVLGSLTVLVDEPRLVKEAGGVVTVGREEGLMSDVSILEASTESEYGLAGSATGALPVRGTWAGIATALVLAGRDDPLVKFTLRSFPIEGFRGIMACFTVPCLFSPDGDPVEVAAMEGDGELVDGIRSFDFKMPSVLVGRRDEGAVWVRRRLLSVPSEDESVDDDKLANCPIGPTCWPTQRFFQPQPFEINGSGRILFTLFLMTR